MRVQKETGKGYKVILNEKNRILEVRNVYSFMFNELEGEISLIDEKENVVNNIKSSKFNFYLLKKKVVWADRCASIGYKTIFFSFILVYLTLWYTAAITIEAISMANAYSACEESQTMDKNNNPQAQSFKQQLLEKTEKYSAPNTEVMDGPSDECSAEIWKP